MVVASPSWGIPGALPPRDSSRSGARSNEEQRRRDVEEKVTFAEGRVGSIRRGRRCPSRERCRGLPGDAAVAVRRFEKSTPDLLSHLYESTLLDCSRLPICSHTSQELVPVV